MPRANSQGIIEIAVALDKSSVEKAKSQLKDFHDQKIKISPEVDQKDVNEAVGAFEDQLNKGVGKLDLSKQMGNIFGKGEFDKKSLKDLRELTDTISKIRKVGGNNIFKSISDIPTDKLDKASVDISKIVNEGAGQTGKALRQTRKNLQDTIDMYTGLAEARTKAIADVSKKYPKVSKYAVDADTAASNARSLAKNTKLSDSQERDLVGYAQRYSSLTGKSAGKGVEEWLEVLRKNYQDTMNSVNTMTAEMVDKTEENFKRIQKASQEQSPRRNQMVNNLYQKKNQTDTTNVETPKIDRNITKPLEEANKEADKLNKKLNTASQTIYHVGDLDHLNKTRKSDNWKDLPSALQEDFGWMGSGAYFTSKKKQSADYFKDFEGTGKKIYSYDPSKLNMYTPSSSKDAKNLQNFLLTMNKYIMSLGGFKDFDKELKGVDINSLFDKYKSIFKDASMSADDFQKFITEQGNKAKQMKYGANGTSSLNENDKLLYQDTPTASLMKKMGYHGINNTGIRGFDNTEQGSVIFDAEDLAKYEKVFSSVDELTKNTGKTLAEVNEKAKETAQSQEKASSSAEKSNEANKKAADNKEREAKAAQETAKANTESQTVPNKENLDNFIDFEDEQKQAEATADDIDKFIEKVTELNNLKNNGGDNDRIKELRKEISEMQKAAPELKKLHSELDAQLDSEAKKQSQLTQKVKETTEAKKEQTQNTEAKENTEQAEETTDAQRETNKELDTAIDKTKVLANQTEQVKDKVEETADATKKATEQSSTPKLTLESLRNGTYPKLTEEEKKQQNIEKYNRLQTKRRTIEGRIGTTKEGDDDVKILKAIDAELDKLRTKFAYIKEQQKGVTQSTKETQSATEGVTKAKEQENNARKQASDLAKKQAQQEKDLLANVTNKDLAKALKYNDNLKNDFDVARRSAMMLGGTGNTNSDLSMINDMSLFSQKGVSKETRRDSLLAYARKYGQKGYNTDLFDVNKIGTESLRKEMKAAAQEALQAWKIEHDAGQDAIQKTRAEMEQNQKVIQQNAQATADTLKAQGDQGAQANQKIAESAQKAITAEDALGDTAASVQKKIEKSEEQTSSNPPQLQPENNYIVGKGKKIRKVISTKKSSEEQIPQLPDQNQQIKSTDKAIQEEGKAVSNAATSENADIDSIKARVEQLTEAFNKKTEAIREEAKVMGEAAIGEIDSLELVQKKVEQVADTISQKKAESNDQVQSTLPSQATEQTSPRLTVKVPEEDTRDEVKNIQQVSEAITEKAEATVEAQAVTTGSAQAEISAMETEREKAEQTKGAIQDLTQAKKEAENNNVVSSTLSESNGLDEYGNRIQELIDQTEVLKSTSAKDINPISGDADQLAAKALEDALAGANELRREGIEETKQQANATKQVAQEEEKASKKVQLSKDARKVIREYEWLGNNAGDYEKTKNKLSQADAGEQVYERSDAGRRAYSRDSSSVKEYELRLQRNEELNDSLSKTKEEQEAINKAQSTYLRQQADAVKVVEEYNKTLAEQRKTNLTAQEEREAKANATPTDDDLLARWQKLQKDRDEQEKQYRLALNDKQQNGGYYENLPKTQQTYIDQYEKTLENIKNIEGQMSDELKSSTEWTQARAAAEEEHAKALKEANDYVNATNARREDTAERAQLSKNATSYGKKLDSLEQQQSSFTGVPTDENGISTFEAHLNKVREAWKAFQEATQKGVKTSSLKEMNDLVQKGIQGLEQEAKEYKDVTNTPKAQNLRNKVDNLLTQSAIPQDARKQLQGYREQLESINEVDFNNVNREVNNLNTQLKLAGQTGKSFGDMIKDRFKSLGAYLASFASFYKVIDVLKQGISIVKDIDTAMTDLRKVTDASEQSFENFRSTAFDIGQQVGATGQTIINAAADWSRLGYSLSEAQELAKSTAIYQNVGDLENADEATQDLVSVMKAFNISADDSLSIVDKLNEVGKLLPKCMVTCMLT